MFNQSDNQPGEKYDNQSDKQNGRQPENQSFQNKLKYKSAQKNHGNY